MNNILSKNLDPKKIFIVNFSKLEGRFDPEYYSNRIDISKCIKLSSLALVKGGKRIPLGYDYSIKKTNNLYLRVVNIDEYKVINFDDLKYISDELYLLLRRYEVFDNDLIISIAGTVGKVKAIKNIPAGKRVILTENCAKIVLKKENILLQFFELVLQTSFVQRQIQLGYIQTTIPKLGLDKILNLYIPPIPTIEKQQRLIKTYQVAIQKKQQKELEAEKLLASIDEYLLDELSISLPEQDNSLETRIFTVQFADVSEKRLDPDYQNIYYKKINKKMGKSKFPMIFLKDVVEYIQSGKTPAYMEYTDIDTKYPIIKAGSYTGDYIDLEKCDYVIKPQYLEIRKGDIFILSAAHQAEYVGKHIKYLNEEPKIKTSFVGELICVRANKEWNSTFLFSLLNTNIYKTLINREKTGQTSHIYCKNLRFLQIPNVPLIKQKQMADYIQKIRTSAKSLQEEAQNILEQAKNEVEQVILGNTFWQNKKHLNENINNRIHDLKFFNSVIC